MSVEARQLVGTWRKAENPPCAALYPAVIRFESNGLYRGWSDPPDGFVTWDVGTWQLGGHDQLSVSTANDAVITYACMLAGDMLTFTDPQGCRFSFRRSGE